MAQGILIVRKLKYELFKRLCSHTFNKGVGGPLFLVGVVGGTIVGVVFNNFILSALIVGVCCAAFLLGVWESNKNPEIVKACLREFFSERMKISTNTSLCDAVIRSIVFAVEIVVKVLDITKRQGDDMEVLSVLGEIDQMLQLQVQSISQIESIGQALRLVDVHQGEQKAISEVTATLRIQNIERLKKMAWELRSSISEIESALETLFLQVTQMNDRASDVVEKQRLANEAAEALKNLQIVVNTRHETAQELVRTLMPNRA